MSRVQLDHIYLSVTDMDRAIEFYEVLLGIKIAHREGNTWADFDLGGFYLGLIDPDIIDKERIVGNNTIPVFLTDDVDVMFAVVKEQGVEIVFSPEDLSFTDYPYRCFHCRDTEGNLIEIAKYERK